MKAKITWIVKDTETGITQIYFHDPDLCYADIVTKIVYFEVEE